MHVKTSHLPAHRAVSFEGVLTFLAVLVTAIVLAAMLAVPDPRLAALMILGSIIIGANLAGAVAVGLAVKHALAHEAR